VSSPSGRHGTSVDVPGHRRHPSSIQLVTWNSHVASVVEGGRAMVCLMLVATSPACCVKKGKVRGREACHSPGSMRTMTTQGVVIIWTTWHLDAVLERSVVGASELAHLGSLLYVVRHIEPWSFVCRWLPCCRCLLLVREIERGREIAHLGVVHLRCHSFAIILSHRRSCVVSCYAACFL